MNNNDPFTIQAIGEITDPAKIRIVLFINNRFVHAPLTEVFAALGVTGVGSTVFAQNTSATAVAVGATTDGANLKLAKSSATGAMTQESTPLTGTWMNCGSAHPAAGTTYSNYRRIA